MNRYGSQKKALAMEKICECLDPSEFLVTDSYPMLRIPDILRRQIPSLR